MRFWPWLKLQVRYRIGRKIDPNDIPDAPHFDAESTSFFKDRLSRSQSYVEFGGGGSSVFAARRGIPAITIENDPSFAHALRRKLKGYPNIRVKTVRTGPIGKWGRPALTEPTPRRLRAWRRYSAAPFQGELQPFPDFVLVDGRFRRSCALEFARRANERGNLSTIMFDDYYTPGREHYAVVEAFLGAPTRIGRAAIFEVGSGALPRAIAIADIEDAARDPE